MFLMWSAVCLCVHTSCSSRFPFSWCFLLQARCQPGSSCTSFLGVRFPWRKVAFLVSPASHFWLSALAPPEAFLLAFGCRWYFS